MEKKSLKIIVSGGGTGGHIFPAISIANALKEIQPDVEILFVGAEGKMEMEKVPNAGYKIVGLPVAGFQRKLSLKTFTFFWKLFKSMMKARKVLKEFKPDALVGVGGYASGPMLKTAQKKGIPTLIQEQNSYAGVTNRLLAKKAQTICVAYEGMEKYFPADKIIMTGNPVRQDLVNLESKKEEALKYFDVPEGQKVILVLGGSLGAKTLNRSLMGYMKEIGEQQDITLIWQTGKLYHADIKKELEGFDAKNVRLYDFITRMDLAFSISDLIVSRAGAGTISELCLVGKPTILIPSPNVTEDHQTKNAQALVKKNAAVMIDDLSAPKELVVVAFELLKNVERSAELSRNILALALPNAARVIAEKVLKLSGKNDIK
ncbi:MAG: undecaprenyldiphospho-muramoylpentapeptide beta-N-acetylglucosaminyltransferase [Bacteroidales bacterium]|nr:MAG: undecaprenyldiphospho-muramoylpentapeptide beta-N-acetylglucosaminyltransferase [Bacteroidales bacterium]